MESTDPDRQGGGELRPRRERRPWVAASFSPRREARFIAVLGLSLLLVAIAVTGKLLQPEPAQAGGARRVDAARIQKLLGEGTLSSREALFFREVEPGKPAGGGAKAPEAR